MGKINPFFEVKGKKFEIKKTRALECKYETICEENKLDDETISLTNDYAKLMIEFEELSTKFRNAKEEYFDDVLNKEKKEIYLAFKELVDDKYTEMKNFELNNKDFSLKAVEKYAYNNGVELLIYALQEQYNLSTKEANDVWNDFTEHLGLQTSRDWINAMIQTLFESEEDEENPFLKQAKAKALQKMEQRKGLSKIKR